MWVTVARSMMHKVPNEKGGAQTINWNICVKISNLLENLFGEIGSTQKSECFLVFFFLGRVFIYFL